MSGLEELSAKTRHGNCQRGDERHCDEDLTESEGIMSKENELWLVWQ